MLAGVAYRVLSEDILIQLQQSVQLHTYTASFLLGVNPLEHGQENGLECTGLFVEKGYGEGSGGEGG